LTRSPHHLVVIVLWVIFASISPVGAATSERDDSFLEITTGATIKRIKTTIHYEEKNSPNKKWFNVKDRYAKNKNELSEYVSVLHNINPKSFLLVDYTEDALSTDVAAYQQVNIIFFPIIIGLRLPLTIEAQRIKVMYGRQFVAVNGFDAGYLLGAQVINLYGEVTYPGGGKEGEHILAPCPVGGLFARYRYSEKLHCKISANYFPFTSIHVGDLVIDGSVSEADLSLEYNYSRHVSLGMSYRYSMVSMDIDAEDYRANGSYSTYGPGIFLKATF
jgi:hypothetical protein